MLLTLFLGLLRESYVLADDQNGRMGMWHDSSICVTLLVRMFDMTQLYA